MLSERRSLIFELLKKRSKDRWKKYEETHWRLKMKRWIKLKRDVESLMAPKLDFRIYANAYSIGDTIPVPRFWITIGGKIIWDWPKDFMNQEGRYF